MIIFISGPLNGIIQAKTSTRTLSMIGSCIITVSLVGFAYSPTVECLFVAYAFYGKSLQYYDSLKKNYKINGYG